MGFGQAISSGFSNLTNFSGRASRSEFWWWLLFVWIINAILAIIINLVTPASDGTANLGILGNIGVLIVSVIFFLATLAVAVRRLHDTGRSGWWVLLYWVCCIGTIVLIVFWVQPSQPGDNQHGAPPV
jgi:uncharacterized membrane protein YhaH (DUF805 family)